MRIFLPLLCVLCATPVHGIFDGTCLRKEPPPGVLVLSPGSKLVLTCGGHVRVNGVYVSMARSSSNTSRGRSSSAATPTTVSITSSTEVSMKSDRQTMENAVSGEHHSNPTEAGVSTVTGDRSDRSRSDSGYTASPNTRMVQPTSASRPAKGESSREAEGMDGDYDYEEEEGGEGSRVTRGIKSRPQWKVKGVTVGKGDWGEITFERRGATLSLPSVRLTDSGKYACYYRGRERLALKVIVAGPPEDPSLSCYKKSPSSKIRCEWSPQKAVTTRPHCYLLLNKRHRTDGFHRQQCSYSSRLSHCWCTLDYNEDELRIPHIAYLCVTSFTGNATSTSLNFTPLEILKPDPPSHVSVRQEKGVKVTWSLPTSWKSQDSFYELIYELKYKPRMSSSYHEQIMHIKDDRSYTITDAMPGVEYVIQLRTKEEYDGRWSDWSAPVYANMSTAQLSALNDSLPTTMFPVYTYWDDYGTNYTDGPGSVDCVEEVSHQVLWILGSFALLSVILAAYVFRHKDRFMSKLQSLRVVTTLCGDSPQPPSSAPTASEGQALVTFAPPHYKEPPPSEVEEVEEENEEEVKERIDAMHFNNAEPEG